MSPATRQGGGGVYWGLRMVTRLLKRSKSLSSEQMVSKPWTSMVARMFACRDRQCAANLILAQQLRQHFMHCVWLVDNVEKLRQGLNDPQEWISLQRQVPVGGRHLFEGSGVGGPHVELTNHLAADAEFSTFLFQLLQERVAYREGLQFGEIEGQKNIGIHEDPSGHRHRTSPRGAQKVLPLLSSPA